MTVFAKALKAVAIKGLVNVFHANRHSFSITEATQACRDTCLSSLSCQYWFLSTSEGCYVDDGGASYPLTTADVSNNHTLSHSVIAGEYIQHLCLPLAKQSPMEELGSLSRMLRSRPKYVIFTVALMLITAICVLCACCANRGTKKKKKVSVNSRGLKRVPTEDPDEAPENPAETYVPMTVHVKEPSYVPVPQVTYVTTTVPQKQYWINAPASDRVMYTGFTEWTAIG